MRKTILLSFILVVGLVFVTDSGLQAQTLQNASFKLYVDQLNDTITLHVVKDSSYVTQGRGGVVVRSLFTVSKDTLTMEDYEGQYACPGQKGVYTFKLTDTSLTMFLVTDPCDGRVGTINGAKWVRQL